MGYNPVAVIKEKDGARASKPLGAQESVRFGEKDVPGRNAASSLRERRPHGVSDQRRSLEHVGGSNRTGAGLKAAPIPGPLARVVVGSSLLTSEEGQIGREVIGKSLPCRHAGGFFDQGKPELGIGRSAELTAQTGSRPVERIEFDEAAVIIADI